MLIESALVLVSLLAAPPASSVAFYEWRDKNSRRRWHAVEGSEAPDGYQRAKKPLCRVWRYPIAVHIAWK